MTTDATSFLSRRRQAIAHELYARFGAYAQKIPPRIAEHMLRFVSEATTPVGGWSENTTMLGTRTGGLRAIIERRAPGSLSKVVIDSHGVNVESGIDTTIVRGAIAHEFGLFIRSGGKMHRWFWAQYIKTGLVFFRIMALHVKSRGGVQMKKRPFFWPGIRSFIADARHNMPYDIFRIVSASLEA